MATVGFVGLGLMGQGFVSRLLTNGHEVVGTDIADAAKEAALTMGVKVVESAGEVAEACRVILVCVTTPAAVEDVVKGPHGVLSRAQEGTVVVDHSTTDIPLTRALGEALSAAGCGFVDAPVSGGPAAAQSGTLAIMGGGAEKDIEAVRPVLDGLGLFTHMGPIGAGQATKLVNQTLVLSNYCVIAEALRLAQAFGVDPAKVPDALAPGHAGSNLLSALMPRMAEEDFEPRGYARQVLKDFEMLHAATRGLPLAMPMAAQATTLFRLLVAGGQAERDGSAVVTLYPKVAEPAD